MKKSDRILMGITIGVGLADLFLANSVYLKKKGVMLRDMALTAIDKKMHRPVDESAEEEVIPIE